MDDGIAAGKCRERLRPQQAMGIGNRANGSHHARSDYKKSRAASPVRGLAMAARQRQDLSRHSPTAHILAEADRTAWPLLSRASITRGGAAASFSARRRTRHDMRG